MPDVSVTIPTEQMARVKAAVIGYFRLNPALPNIDVLTFIKGRFALHLRDIVREWEISENQRTFTTNTDVVAS